MPDLESRLSILKSCLRKSPISKDVDLNYIAVHTDKFTGADLTEICQRAAKLAIRECISREAERSRLAAESGAAMDDVDEEDLVPEIMPAHFEEAVRASRRSVSDAQIAKYQSFGAVLNTARGEMEQFRLPSSTAAFAAPTADDEDEDDLYN
eukprot:493773_1